MALQPKISAVVITKNEENIIGKCIDALFRVADEVIVVDSMSTDQTVTICETRGAKVFLKEWAGYSENKNFGISHTKNDWVISLDADEILDNDLIQNINKLDLNPKQLYFFNFLTNYCGHWVKHCGWYPRWRPRLFKKGTAEWDGKQVHEELVPLIKLKKTRIPGLIKHYSYHSIQQHQGKMVTYAKYRAKEWISMDKSPSLFRRIFGPTVRFLRGYVYFLGFLDGQAGLNICREESKMIRKQIRFYDQFTQE